MDDDEPDYGEPEYEEPEYEPLEEQPESGFVHWPRDRKHVKLAGWDGQAVGRWSHGKQYMITSFIIWYKKSS